MTQAPNDRKAQAQEAWNKWAEKWSYADAYEKAIHREVFFAGAESMDARVRELEADVASYKKLTDDMQTQLAEDRTIVAKWEAQAEHERKMRAASDRLLASGILIPTEEYGEMRKELADAHVQLKLADELADTAERISPKIHFNDLVKPLRAYRKARGEK